MTSFTYWINKNPIPAHPLHSFPSLWQQQVLLGAVGAFDWSGGVMLYNTDSHQFQFLNESVKEPGTAQYSYLGEGNEGNHSDIPSPAVNPILNPKGTRVVLEIPCCPYKCPRKHDKYRGSKAEQLLLGVGEGREVPFAWPL